METTPEKIRQIALAAWPSLKDRPEKVEQAEKIVQQILIAIEQLEPKKTDKRGTRLAPDFKPPQDWLQVGTDARARHELPFMDLRLELEQFCGYWSNKPGKDGLKLDWKRAWIVWATRANESKAGRRGTADMTISGSQDIAERHLLQLAAKGIKTGSMSQALLERGIAEGIIGPAAAKKLGFGFVKNTH